jgi:hypothetical protein
MTKGNKCDEECRIKNRVAKLAVKKIGLRVESDDAEDCEKWQTILNDLFGLPANYHVTDFYGVGRDAVVIRAIPDNNCNPIAIRLAATCMKKAEINDYLERHQQIVDKGLALPILDHNIKPIKGKDIFPDRKCDKANSIFIVYPGCEQSWASLLKDHTDEEMYTECKTMHPKKKGMEIWDLLYRTITNGIIMVDFRLPNIMKYEGSLYHIDTEEHLLIPKDLMNKALMHSALVFFFNLAYMGVLDENSWIMVEAVYKSVIENNRKLISQRTNKVIDLVFEVIDGREETKKIVDIFHEAFRQGYRKLKVLFLAFGYQAPREKIERAVEFYYYF